MNSKNEIKKVIFVLRTRWEAELEILRDRLQRSGVSCIRCSGCEEAMQYLESLSERKSILVMTDERGLAEKLENLGIACIGCDLPGAPYFAHVGMVAETLTGLDAVSLEEYLLHYHHLPVTIDRTERLILREITEADFDTLARIGRQAGAENFFTGDRLAAYIGHAYSLYGYGLWSVLKADGTLIGCCGLSDCIWEDGENRLELQYMLDQAYQKRGYGAEMCEAALRYAFTRTDAVRVYLRIHPENTASKRLARKLGFTGIGSGKDGMQHFMLENAGFEIAGQKLTPR